MDIYDMIEDRVLPKLKEFFEKSEQENFDAHDEFTDLIRKICDEHEYVKSMIIRSAIDTEDDLSEQLKCIFESLLDSHTLKKIEFSDSYDRVHYINYGRNEDE